MRIIITLELENSKNACDVQVAEEQRITDTIQVLKDNLSIFKNIGEITYVREKESRRKISTELTYAQANIYSGSELVIG